MGYFNQVLCTLISCYSAMVVGVLFTWPSATLNIFASPNTTLHRPMEETELALFGALSSIGAMVSTPAAGLLLDIVGRKNSLIAAALAQLVGWALVSCFHQVEVILTAVFISGLGGCAMLIVPIYVSEVCQESIRGTMTAIMMIFYALGMLASYILGGLLSYHAVVYVSLSLSAIGVAVLVVVRETPVYLMKKGLEQEAQKSYAFYRNASFDSKLVLQEMSALRRAFNPDLDDDLPAEEKKLNTVTMDKHVPKEKLNIWSFIKKSRATRQAMTIVLFIMTASLFQGLIAVQVYAEPLFLEAVPYMSPMIASVLMAILTIVFGLIAAYLTDVSGRRPLIIYASIASGLCCIALGSQLHLHWGPHWVTALFIYLFTIAYTVGAGTVPYVLNVEVFLPEIKSFMSMIVIEWAWLCNFLLLFIFNPLVSAIGLGQVFYVFAAICFVTAGFSCFFLPETKGLPIDVIQTLFTKKRRVGRY